MSIVKLDHHEHEFKLEIYNKGFQCDGCREQGFGSRYKCEHCSYELHPECKCRKPTITHDFFPGSVFKFYEQLHIPGSCGRSCDACGTDIKGFVYHCWRGPRLADGWDLHPCCSKLEKELRIDGTDFILRDKVTSECMWCKNKKLCGTTSRVPGWSYVSGCGKYHFHVYCVAKMVAKMVHEVWKKGEVDESSDSSALDKIDLRVVAKSGRKGGSGSGFGRTIRIFLKTIVAILLGDPTITLACVLFDVLSK
ncbi:hypothetical protein Acr_02g0004230 [Actinidia rufa]|uniref:Phorbol-ester/DAG-type domain-containing protein n=1 Tax=Actinidia rufa TaxID=165716 RepID=A0A7J0E6Q5_9ERIC|nr:hypothetical protein Acr_02g0004230 [Actinidia rufa]